MTANLIRIAGVLHFGILIASALVPGVLDWKRHLAGLPALLRHLIWTHGAFIVLTIISFGVLSVAFPNELAAATPLARGVCGIICIFWLARLSLQFFLFDARPYLRRFFLKIGYHALTGVFVTLVLIYGLASMQ